MSSTFNEANLVKKLENVTSSQDSIQTLSLWVLHHKSHYKKIVDQWLKCYLKAKNTHQLALFYLANDIVQHAKRKNFPHYLTEFENALKEAAKITNDEKTMTSINRVLNIWIERSVYSKAFVEELRQLLGSGERIKVEVMTKIISDFSLTDVIQQVNNVAKLEQYTQSKIQNLANCNVDFTNPDLLNKLKDKSYGEQFSKEIEEASKALNSIINSIEREINYRRILLATLEKSKVFYNVQMKEAKTVAETFNNCELRLKQVQTIVSKNKNNSSNNSLSSLANSISTSQLSDVLSYIQKASSSSGQPSSLDQRLNSLMSNSGQFQMNLDQKLNFNPNFNNHNTANDYSPGTSFPAGSYNDNRTTEPVLTTRNSEPTENFEPADMDLGDSEDEDGNPKSTNKSAENSESRKRSLEETLPQFPMPQDLPQMLQFIPPPPPPPMPPPLLREIFENDLDNFNSGPPAGLSDGNAMRHSSDRYSPRNQSFNHQNQQGGSASQWRTNQSDGRGPSRSYHYSNHNRHGNRWKNNGTGGGWKRNSFGSSNHY